jgi:glycosyltransferase involved in cell wall biosynthesis
MPVTPRPAHRSTLVIVPAYNEAAVITRTLADLRAARPDLDVVVVDDGSTDDTARLAAESGAVVLSLPFNLGIGGALRTGFRYAVRHGYTRAVQFDADGQHDAAEIATVLAAVDAGADMAVGSRFADRESGASAGYEVGRVRAGAMAVLRLLVGSMSGQRFTDTSSGFRAFSRPMLEFFAAWYPIEYMESVEALLLAAAEGFAVREVPVVMHQRSDGMPSQRRLALLYHFLRVLLVLAVAAPRRRHLAGVTS